ncbi:hypothetical protein HELRODRAFT_89375, partial [Helobdella robusta]|uniref:3-beta hydroxysteroid dehydrogenase/isomerase domain-containing protein n=1 Tax=Helobdella robusta TaxID=6412 RepID=T1G7C5_HELRO
IGNKTKPEVVLISGSSGFVGQHVVKSLQHYSENVREIVLFDVKPYRNRLKHSTEIPMRQIIGDVTKLDEVRRALKGVDSVVHTAGLVEFGSCPDVERLMEVNVKGTANIIQASVENKVSRLVYTSSVDVVIGFEELVDVTEGDCPTPAKLLFEGYPESKRQAENLVLKAHGRVLVNNYDDDYGESKKYLSTLSLRPSVLYGEEDPYYVTSGLKSAQKNNGVLYRVGDGSAVFQQAYAGNIAYAHVCALAALARDCNLGGRAFFVTDDTPCLNSFAFMQNFLPLYGYRLSDWYIPYPAAYSLFWVFDVFIRILKPVFKLNTDINLASIIYVNKTFTFNRRACEDVIGYKPIYSPEESIERSKKYYSSCLDD